MSLPVRAHLISLNLVLGLTVSLVWGQTPTSLTLSGVTVTGPIAITSVGRGTSASLSLICHVTNPINTVWLFPDESTITQVITNVVATDSFIFRRLPTSNIVLLRRGPSVLSPVGKYCCGSATIVNERLCIDLVVDCETPLSISNGSPGTTTSTLIGQTVTYTCNSGYQISLGVTMATVSCLASGNWETVPTCSAVDCGTLTDPTNGRVSTPSGTTFMNIATYSCDNGYMLNGDMTRTCGSDVAWTLTEPSCSLIDCGSLTDPTNGGVTTSSGTTFMNIATYSCDNGYTLTGVVTRTCGSDGMWTLAEPTCPPVDCGSLNAPTNGEVTTPSGTTFMNTATYSCTTGYTVTGDMTRTCDSNGMWTLAEPACPPVECETPPSISSGSLGTPTKTTFEGTVTYTCNNGYQISPGITMATASCQATGNWETVTCSAIDCGSLNAPTNGGVTTPSGTTFMNTATYSCDNGYTLTGDLTRTCGSDGMWTLTEPSCPPVDCGSLNGPTNGGVTTPSGTTFMNTVTYSCDSGYTLTGDMIRTCGSNGMWTLTEPSCHPVDCGTLTDPTNGRVTTPSGTTLMNTATYS